MKIRIKDDVFEVIKIERSEHMYYDSIVHITIPFSEKIEKFTEDWYWNKETKNIISEERTYWTCKLNSVYVFETDDGKKEIILKMDTVAITVSNNNKNVIKIKEAERQQKIDNILRKD